MFFDMRLWAFTEGVRLRIFFTTFVGLLASFVGVARLAGLGWLLAQVFQGSPFHVLWQPLALVAGLMVLRGFLEYGRNMLAHETSAKVQVVLRKSLYDKITELGPAYFGLHRTGDVLLSVVDGVEQLEVYFGQYIPQLMVSVLVPITLFAFVWFLDGPVALVMVGFALFTLLAPALFSSWNSKASRARQKSYSAFGAEFLDTVQGLATLQAFGQSGNRGRSLAKKSHDLFESNLGVLMTNALTRGITDTGVAVGAAAMLGLGAYRVTHGEMSMEALLMILMMGIEVFRPLRELRELLHTGMMGQSAAAGIFRLLDQKSLIPKESESTKTKYVGPLNPTIRFESVSFRYPGNDQPTHQAMDFEVKAGERIGIVGTSGGGKSTIVRLLLRLYDPQKGTVRIGGKDIRDISQQTLYEQISMVQQDTYLFHGTVADNLKFGKPNATLSELVEAAQTANAHEFIEKLPQGYHTVIGERGIKLSGGQRQRIAIARAVLRNAPILILDEALSSVDTENESVIQEALNRAMEGKTTLVLAHRLSSVIDSDRILVLDQGQIAEQGRHPELMRKKGIYYRLMSVQTEQAEGDFLPNTLENRKPKSLTQNDDNQVLAINDAEPSDAILKAEGLGWGETIKHLTAQVVPWKNKLLLTFLFGVTRVGALIGVGILSALIVAAVKNDTPYETWLIALFILAPLAGILHWLESWLAHDMAFRLLSQLRIKLFKKLDALGPAYLTQRRSGDLAGTATHDVELVEYFFAHTITPAFVAVLVPAVILCVLLVSHPLLALALFPFLAIVGGSPFLLRKRIDALGSRAREAMGSLNAHVTDTIQGLSEIIAFQQIDQRGQELVEKTKDHHRIRLPFFRDLTLQTAILEMATGLGGLTITISGAYLVHQGSLDSGLLPLLTLISMAAFLPVSEIAHIGRQLADTLGAARRMYAVDHEPILVKDGTEAKISSTGNKDLEIDQMEFSYLRGGPSTLQNVHFTIPSGKMVALVGPSGAGKTTIAHLLMRFWDPQGGEIRFQGKPITQFQLEDLRQNIALVTQDTYLFNTTLRENITIANPSASEADLEKALQRASLTDFIKALPDGLETPVGERGVRLSGGQRQRVSIARAFLKDASILILDEATSHLDAVNEKLVHHALEDLMHDRTTIVIAHRLSTVRHAHRIVVLDQGRVVETGTHRALLAKGGLYSHLVGRQIEALQKTG